MPTAGYAYALSSISRQKSAVLSDAVEKVGEKVGYRKILLNQQKRSHIFDKERKRLHFCNYPDKCDHSSQLLISTSDGFI